MNINEALQAWQEGKTIVCTLDGKEYLFNQDYNEELEIPIKFIARGTWTIE